MYKLHKISPWMFSGAPSLKKVQSFIQKIAREHDCIFVGHAVEDELAGLKLQNVKYIDTSKNDLMIRKEGFSRIPAGILFTKTKCHCSIFDALKTMAVFMYLDDHKELNQDRMI